eukprot:838396-Amorphochlora_amoeboformis.AAC.1
MYELEVTIRDAESSRDIRGGDLERSGTPMLPVSMALSRVFFQAMASRERGDIKSKSAGEVGVLSRI